MKKAKPKNSYYALFQIAKKNLSIGEDDYREILRQFGAKEKNDKISATTMTVPQLEKALSHFKSLGFKPVRKNVKLYKQKQLDLIKAFWNRLHKAGVMRKPYSDAVASKYAYRITKLNQITWANSAQLSNVIEALKGMANREGVSLEYSKSTKFN